jgi:hypothetical protein
MAKQKFRIPERPLFFKCEGIQVYVKVLKKHCNTGGRTFCDATKNNLCTLAYFLAKCNALKIDILATIN